MGEPDNRITTISGMNTWRAGCGESRTSGSEGGPEKPTSRKVDRALRSDPYTQHSSKEGNVFLAAIVDAWSRRVIGWSIADHLRTELVADALDMAIWRRRPQPGSGLIHHADHGTQYTSWAFGQRLRTARLLGSMGTVDDALDNATAESFFGTLQLELLDRRQWETRAELAQAIFEYIEVFSNAKRRHSSIGYHSPIDYETRHTPARAVA